MDVENRRGFFSEFAQSKGFDPLDLQQWKQCSALEVIHRQVRYSYFYIPLKTNYQSINEGNCWALEDVRIFTT